MKKNRIISILGVVSLSFLISCSAPSTPQQVTEAFWNSVVKGDVDDVVKYSTLTDNKQYDNFSKSWEAYSPSLGRITIENDRASIETRLSSSANSDEKTRSFTTHLVKRDNHWLVEYSDTREDVQGGPLGGLLGKLDQAGKSLSRHIGEAASDLEIELKQLGEKIEKRADSLDKETRQNINDISEKMRRHLDELQRSIQRALKDKQWSDQDRQALHEISDDLDTEQERLSGDDLDSIATSSRNIGRSQRRLNNINTENADSYKKDWNARLRDIRNNLSELVDKL